MLAIMDSKRDLSVESDLFRPQSEQPHKKGRMLSLEGAMSHTDMMKKLGRPLTEEEKDVLGQYPEYASIAGGGHMRTPAQNTDKLIKDIALSIVATNLAKQAALQKQGAMTTTLPGAGPTPGPKSATSSRAASASLSRAPSVVQPPGLQERALKGEKIVDTGIFDIGAPVRAPSPSAPSHSTLQDFSKTIAMNSDPFVDPVATTDVLKVRAASTAPISPAVLQKLQAIQDWADAPGKILANRRVQAATPYTSRPRGRSMVPRLVS
jgi:hypothetical protein